MVPSVVESWKMKCTMTPVLIFVINFQINRMLMKQKVIDIFGEKNVTIKNLKCGRVPRSVFENFTMHEN